MAGNKDRELGGWIQPLRYTFRAIVVREGGGFGLLVTGMKVGCIV